MTSSYVSPPGTKTAPPDGRAAGLAAAAGALRLAPRRRRRWSRLTAGVMTVLVCLFGFLAASSAVLGAHATQVLAVARAVPAGAALTPADLTVVSVHPAAGVATVPGGEQAQLAGRTAAVPLTPGTLLSAAELGPPQYPPAGEAVIALPLAAGAFPPQMQAGARVAVLDGRAAGSASVGQQTAPVRRAGGRGHRDHPGRRADGGQPAGGHRRRPGRRAARLPGAGAAGPVGNGRAMTLIACASVSGSPGVTTAALGLAAYWPLDLTPLLAEADPSGGDLQVLFSLPESPGTVSLAAAARPAGPDLLWRHAQWLTPRLAVVPGPAGADQAAATGARLAAGSWAPVTAAAASGAMIVADCGRASPGTPAAPLIQAADVLLIVTTADAAALAHLHARLGALRRLNPKAQLLLTGPRGPWPPAEISATLQAPVAGAAARPGRGVGAARPPRPPRPGHPVARPGTAAAADRRRGHRSPARQPPGRLPRPAATRPPPARRVTRRPPWPRPGQPGQPRRRPAPGRRPVARRGPAGQGATVSTRQDAPAAIPWPGAVTGGPDQQAVTGQLRAQVAAALARHAQDREETGQGALPPGERHAVVSTLISQALEEHATAALRSGQPALDAAAEKRVTRAVTAALLGLGGLQALLDDPQVENIDVNGHDQVFAGYADGRIARAAPVAASTPTWWT